MEMNRKAVFFSITALIIVALLFFIVRPSSISENSQESAYVRVQNVNQDRALIEDSSIPLLIKAETRKALNKMAISIRASGPDSRIGDLDDFQDEFRACVLTGLCLDAIATSDSLGIRLANLSDQYNQLQYNTSFVVTDINLTQIGTWTLLVQAEVILNMEDDADFARINKNITVEELISIQGLIDPMMSYKLTDEVNGGDLAAPGGIRVIREHQFRVGSGLWTPSEFVRHVRNGTYIRDTYGPSYIGRFYRNPPRNNTYGIRSLWPANTFSGMQGRSYADYNDGRLIASPDTDCFMIVGFSPTVPFWSPPEEIILHRDQEAFVYLSMQSSGGDFTNHPDATCT